MTTLPQYETFQIITDTNCDTLDDMDLDELLPIERQQLLEEEEAERQQMSLSRPRVTFDEMVEIELIEPCSSLSEEEKNAVWYPQTELDSFKKKARQLCAMKRRRKYDHITKNESTRGLEVYAPQRMRNHANAIAHVLHAYYQGGSILRDADNAARVSQHYSAQASEHAMLVAVQDFYDAYLVPQHNLFQSKDLTQSPNTIARKATPQRSASWERGRPFAH